MWIYSVLALEITLLIWYILLFYKSTSAWTKEVERSYQYDGKEHITVLIAMRNERKHLGALINALKAQSYLSYEVLLIDDHSTDGSFELAKSLGSDLSFLKCLRLEDGKRGKKSALAFGVTHAQSEWILCTDADCVPQKYWIDAMLSYAVAKEKVFVSGPVQFRAGNTWFTHWQALEFSGLISLGASAIFRKAPTMCNGANILYRKDVFEMVGGYLGNEGIASGDDQFLMHRVFERFPNGIGFCKNRSAIVSTDPVINWMDFISQRIRWASKNGQFERRSVTWEMIGVWFMSFVILVNPLLGSVNPVFFLAFLVLLFGKGLVEYQFYRKTLSFYDASDLKKNFWLSELFQVIYVFCIGLLGKFVRYEWKGRK